MSTKRKTYTVDFKAQVIISNFMKKFSDREFDLCYLESVKRTV